MPLALCALAFASATAEAKSSVSGDFDGDGFDDLGVGVPFRNAGSVEEAGAVFVFGGSASRLIVAGSQLWHQDSSGIADAAEFGDRFGSPVAAGDFNGSGHDDLAVGVPRERLDSASDAGAVNVIYGAGIGLESAPGESDREATGRRSQASWSRRATSRWHARARPRASVEVAGGE